MLVWDLPLLQSYPLTPLVSLRLCKDMDRECTMKASWRNGRTGKWLTFIF